MMKTLRQWIMMMSLIGAVVSCGDNYSDALKDEIDLLNSPLEILITSHNNQQVVIDSTVTLSGKIIAPKGVSRAEVIVNGVTSSLNTDGATFSKQITLVQDIYNSIIVVVYDKLERTAKHEIALACDTLAPVIAITSPIASEEVSGWQTTLVVSCTEYQFAISTVTVNGVTSNAALVNGVNYLAVQLNPGSNTVRVDGIDMGGRGGSSGDRTFTLNPLISPKNSFPSELKPLLDWSDHYTPSAQYDVQISTVSDFSSTAEQQTNLAMSQYSLLGSLEVGTKYFWRIQVRNSSGTVIVPWITPSSFRIISNKYVYFKIADTGQTTCGDCPGSGNDSNYPNVPLSRNFTDNGLTITDNRTGLIWVKCTQGLSGSDCTTGSASTYTWSAAMNACSSLSYSSRANWRLPSVVELMTLINFENEGPSLDTVYFPNIPSSAGRSYWTSTSFSSDSSYAWYVSFENGYTQLLNSSENVKDKTYFVRCVTGPD
ncbi:MAG TPA: DUF1566 domain-containing protein [Spirochaetota bacterium]|nr:DUF1566 domain-containing protein [Spirochaetota bacterium]HNT10738.1 DUF1566 domain-containing protein [Spirochaetota bacterium]